MGARRIGPPIVTYAIVVIGSFVMGISSGGMYINSHGGRQTVVPIILGIIGTLLGVVGAFQVETARVRLAFMGVAMLGLGMLIAGFTLAG